MLDRNDRARAVLQTLVAEFIGHEANPTPLITVTRIMVPSDFHEATIFVTVYPEEREADALHFLMRKGTELRDYVKKHGRLRMIPHFEFAIDLGDKHRRVIDEVAYNLSQEEKSKEKRA